MTKPAQAPTKLIVAALLADHPRSEAEIVSVFQEEFGIDRSGTRGVLRRMSQEWLVRPIDVGEGQRGYALTNRARDELLPMVRSVRELLAACADSVLASPGETGHDVGTW